MAKPLHIVGKLRTNLRITQYHAGRREVSPRTLHTVDSPTAIKSPQTPLSKFASKVKDGAQRVLWGSGSPTHAVAAAGAVKTATDIPSSPTSNAVSDVPSPPANVLEEIARNLPQSSLYNTYKYDVTGDAPYPLWFLDPNGVVYPHVISIARNASSILESFHDFTGAPWWLAVVLGGVAVRIAVMPFTIYSLRNASRAVDAKEDITAITRAFNKAVSRVGKGNAAEKFRLMMIAKKGIVAALEKAHCYPLRSLAMPLLQIPIVITGVLGARHSVLTGNEAFEREGALWFNDLTVHDPYYVLPLVSMGLTYATLEVIFGKSRGSKTGAAGLLGAGLGNTVKSGFQMSLILSAPFLTELPAGLYLLMMTNSVWTIGYLTAVRSPAVYKTITGKDLPSATTPIEQPPAASSASSTPTAATTTSTKEAATPTMSSTASMRASDASNVHIERSVINSSPSHFVVPTASSVSSSTSSSSGGGVSQRMTMHTQAVMHTAPVMTPPPITAQAEELSAPPPQLAFPQFVTVTSTDLEQASTEIASQLNEAIQGMNAQWPLLSGTPNPFVLRIAAGAARAPWYIPPALNNNTEKKPASNAMAQQIVKAVKSALADGDAANTKPNSKIAAKHLTMSSYVPEADITRPFGRNKLSFEGYRRVYLGDIGNMPYGITGPTPWELSVVKGPADSVETIPGLLDMTLAGRHKRAQQMAAEDGGRAVKPSSYAASSGGSNSGHSGNAAGSGNGVSNNGDGNNNNNNGGKKDDGIPLVEAISSKRAAPASADAQGYVTSSSSGLSTDSDSAISSDDDVKTGRKRRKHVRFGQDRHTSKLARKALLSSLLGKGEAQQPELPKVSRRSSRRWARILQMTAIKVRPSARDKLLQRTQQAKAEASAAAAAAQKETVVEKQEAVEQHISPVPHKQARKSSEEILGFDVSSELTKLAFTQEHEKDASATDSNNKLDPSTPLVDDHTMRMILGEHFESWVKEEIQAGRRSSVIEAATEAEGVAVVIPAAMDLEEPSEAPLFEVIQEERRKPEPSTKKRMAGTITEDGTFIAEDDDATHTQSANPKRLDLAHLLRETDHRNVGAKNTNSGVVDVEDDSSRSKLPTKTKDSAKPFDPQMLDIPEMPADVTHKFANLDIVSDFQVDFGYAREISPGSAAVPTDDTDESSAPTNSKDEHERRVAQLKNAAGHFLDKSRHLSHQGRRKRGQHPPHLHSTLTFERNKSTRRVGAVSKLVFAGLSPTAVPFPFEQDAAVQPSEDVEDLLNRIQLAIGDSTSGSSHRMTTDDGRVMESAPPGVLAGDVNAEKPVYDASSRSSSDKRTHKPSSTFPFGDDKKNNKNESD